MIEDPAASGRLLSVVLALGQYPILAARIRARMRRELFERGVVSAHAFDAEVRQKAIVSQEREGLFNPYVEEAADVWDQRCSLLRDQLTDWYFSQHLPFELLQAIIREVLSERGVPSQDLTLSVNPELAPIDLLFQQAHALEAMPPGERAGLEPRLRETKVVLIRHLISDQLGYINIAKEWFTIGDLDEIRRRKIGPGKIGGKAAGMMLAWRILQQVGGEELRSRIRIPDSYFLGADGMYAFMSLNNLVHWNDQKYKTEDQMREDYPRIQRDFEAGQFPPDTLEKLQNLLVQVGKQPLIVRSSSLLEDNFGTSFAGKYDSFFCPNQGSLQENLNDLSRAIARIYSTTLNPNALLYRRSKGLQDYDERMAVLIQVVEGETFERYFFPTAAGVAFSRNLYRWSPQIRREDGFVRLVWGLGTRAVDRLENDYPRLVALSHPLLRPSSAPKDIRRYSQQWIDLIDLQDNSFRTAPIAEVLQSRYPALRYVAQVEQDGFYSSLRSSVIGDAQDRLAVTFEEFLRRTPFALTMRRVLMMLQEAYRSPVDVEFTVGVLENNTARPEIRLSIIQCRPQSHLRDTEQVQTPANLPAEQVMFATRYMVPEGSVCGVRRVLFVTPEGYFALPTAEARSRLVRVIAAINEKLAGQPYICLGPGRWGTSNTDLGVSVAYSDIYNARALIEMTGQNVGHAPDPSFGTHFFQDLMEAQIYPLALFLDDPHTIFRRDFFYETPNHLTDLVPGAEDLRGALRLIEVADYQPGAALNLVMEDEQNRAIAYLAPTDQD